MPESLAAADGWWAGFFGCAPAELRPAHPRVHSDTDAPAGRAGVYLQTFGGAPLALIPPRLIPRFGARVTEAAADGLAADDRWRGVFGDALGPFIGPAEVRYADRGTFRPDPRRDGVRLLTNADRPAFDTLRQALAPLEWEHGGSEWGEHPLAGAFADRVLAAVAGYEVWGGRLAHIAIVTHPAFREQGLGRAAVSRITAEALERGLVAQYRALATNTPSIAIAGRLGFQPHSVSLAIRLNLSQDHGEDP